MLSLLAAWLWLRSATIHVPPVDDGQASITVDGDDFIATALAQSRLSRQAALAAGLAAAFQCAGLLLGMFDGRSS